MQDDQVERLDFSKLPPGYDVVDLLDEGDGEDPAYTWTMDGEIMGREPTRAKAVETCWAHHKKRHDPPGLCIRTQPQQRAGVRPRGAGRAGPGPRAPGASGRRAPGLCIRIAVLGSVLEFPLGGPIQPVEIEWHSKTFARAAAWAWYERRLALASRLASNVCGFDDWHHWPRCLDWSDADCDAVDRWLAEVPEVLREA